MKKFIYWILGIFGWKKKAIITNGNLPFGISEDDAWKLAVANTSNPPIGVEVGNFIYYKHYCSEIINKKNDELKLTSSGWVKLKKCRLTP